MYSCHDNSFIAYPNVIANHDITFIVPSLCGAHVMAPGLVENGEGIVGEGVQGVVGAVEEEPDPAGNGTEFSYYQPVFVDGIMI